MNAEWLSRAEEAGKNSEEMVGAFFKSIQRKGFPVYKQYTLEDYRMRAVGLFSDGRRVDFLVEGLPGLPGRTIFSVKFQDSGGTTEEKLYYHVHYMIKQCYAHPTVLVLTGGHWKKRPHFIEWVHEQIDGEWLLDVIEGYDALVEWGNGFGIRHSPLPPKQLQGQYSSGDPVDGEQPWLL